MIRKRVFDETRLTISAGIAANKVYDDLLVWILLLSLNVDVGQGNVLPVIVSELWDYLDMYVLYRSVRTR